MPEDLPGCMLSESTVLPCAVCLHINNKADGGEGGIPMGPTKSMHCRGIVRRLKQAINHQSPLYSANFCCDNSVLTQGKTESCLGMQVQRAHATTCLKVRALQGPFNS